MDEEGEAEEVGGAVVGRHQKGGGIPLDDLPRAKECLGLRALYVVLDIIYFLRGKGAYGNEAHLARLMLVRGGRAYRRVAVSAA